MEDSNPRPTMTNEKEQLIQQLDQSDNKGEFLQNLGKEELEKALNTYFGINCLDDADGTKRKTFVEVLLSPFKLRDVTKRLDSEKLIQTVTVIQPDDQYFIHDDGLRLVMDKTVIIISYSTLENVKDEQKQKLSELMKLDVEKPPELSYFSITRQEKIKGFKKVMHTYALQVAGLMYINSGSDFWEEYKNYMKDINPKKGTSFNDLLDKLEREKQKVAQFKEDMQFVIEVVPAHWACTIPGAAGSLSDTSGAGSTSSETGDI